MLEKLFIRKLSGKLLLLTILFVMVAEVLIFIPSAAMFRQTWLTERAEGAGLLTLAIEGVPNYEGGEMLSNQFMKDTDVSMVAQKRDGMSQLVLGMPPLTDKIILADLRAERRLPLFRDSFRDFFGDGSAYIRILSEPTVDGVDALEVLVPQSALKAAMLDYSKRVLLWSLAISLLTGMMIYAALSRIIARPIRKLASGLARFRKDPRKRTGVEKPVTRNDEIGQLEREFRDMKSGIRSALKQQERLATLGMAMAKINHDLRNVLTSTQLISDRLASDPDERIRGMGERLVRSVDRGVKLCEATLSFSQSAQEKPEPRPVVLAKLLDEAAADSMAEEGEVKFVNAVPGDLIVMADPDHSYRIFHNLFRNAVQAMQTSPRQTLKVEAERKDGKACIKITDTGPGIADSVKADMFKAFTTGAKKGGTGLGLTISRELARAQGGNLSLETTDEDGTVFVVGLPLVAEEKN
ncbi:MAG: HAMP domain-containing histidine kinase [Robiginitomaculum sp.]|nr:HAMP domain-containing histidine kinase [Robiginitomaculum sp.]